MICLVYSICIIIRTMNNWYCSRPRRHKGTVFPVATEIIISLDQLIVIIQMRLAYDITVFRGSRSLQDTIFKYISIVYVYRLNVILHIYHFTTYVSTVVSSSSDEGINSTPLIPVSPKI